MSEERRQLSLEQAASLLSQQDAAAEQAKQSEPAAAPPQTPPVQAEAQPPETNEAQDAEPTPEPTATAEPEETTSEEAGQQPQQAEEQSEEVEVQTLDELAEYLEVEPGYIMAMKLKAKAGDTEADVSVGDLLKSFQLEGTLQKKLSDHGRERKQWEEQHQVAQQELSQKLQNMDAMMARFEDQLIGNDIDWKDLRDTDPQEYAARKADVMDRREAFNKARQELSQQLEQQKEAQFQQWQKQFGEARQHMWANVKAAFPEWSLNDDAARKGESVLVDYLIQDLGFSEDDLRVVTDPRLIISAEKARRYDELKDGKSLVKKKLRKAKKVIRPGHAPSKSEGQDDKVTALRKQFKKSGNVRDMAAVLSAQDRARGI